MTPDELEQKAERAVRRGELLVALEHFDAYLAEQPDDERIRTRMEAVRALLQPSELVSRRRAEPEEADAKAVPVGSAEVGEMHASSGRFAELRERLEELRALAHPRRKADLGAGEKLEAVSAASVSAERSARAHAASFAPLPVARPLPREPKEMLEELLSRVRTGRRG